MNKISRHLREHLYLFFLFVCLFVVFAYLFPDRVCLSSPVCVGTHFVDQAGLEFRDMCLPLPPECWD